MFVFKAVNTQLTVLRVLKVVNANPGQARRCRHAQMDKKGENPALCRTTPSAKVRVTLPLSVSNWQNPQWPRKTIPHSRPSSLSLNMKLHSFQARGECNQGCLAHCVFGTLLHTSGCAYCSATWQTRHGSTPQHADAHMYTQPHPLYTCNTHTYTYTHLQVPLVSP